MYVYSAMKFHLWSRHLLDRLLALHAITVHQSLEVDFPLFCFHSKKGTNKLFYASSTFYSTFLAIKDYIEPFQELEFHGG